MSATESSDTVNHGVRALMLCWIWSVWRKCELEMLCDKSHFDFPSPYCRRTNICKLTVMFTSLKPALNRVHATYNTHMANNLITTVQINCFKAVMHMETTIRRSSITVNEQKCTCCKLQRESTRKVDINTEQVPETEHTAASAAKSQDMNSQHACYEK